MPAHLEIPPGTSLLPSLDLDCGDEFVIVNKPAGFSTHATSAEPQSWGIAEYVEQELRRRGVADKVYVVHRLDKMTTGVLFLATTLKMAQRCLPLFQNHEAVKVYQFVSRWPNPQTHVECQPVTLQSRIEKVGKVMENDPDHRDPNATTEIRRIKGNAFFALWEAKPKTGRTHQVRLHAAQMGFPILGDLVYGGPKYPHLCLHAASLNLPGIGHWQKPAPVFFERMGLLRDSHLVQILSAFDSRQRLFRFLSSKDISCRLSHLENPDCRVDLFGSVLWVSWYRDSAPTSDELLRWKFVADFTGRNLVIRPMVNRGQNPQGAPDFTTALDFDQWTFQENGLQFQGRLHQGLSPGLFLDQRENRRWVRENAKAKSFLNLFAYTCGFSVAASLGGAQEVISVDLSGQFLDWGKANLELNTAGLSQIAAVPQSYAMDSERFLEGAKKHGRKFDLIVCDPPSFGRNAKKIWKIQKDYPRLLQLLWDCLAVGGQALLSTNFEGWTAEDFHDVILKSLPPKQARLEAPAFRVLDFERPREKVLMKCWILTKSEGKLK